MAPRPTVRRERNNDFSAVGKVGRRTGITLPQRRLDENGLEEMSGLFSSPHKPSPLSRQANGLNDTRENSTLDISEAMTGMDSMWQSDKCWVAKARIIMLDHIFSPSDQLPLVAHLMRYFRADLSDAAGTGLTPTQVLSTRKSLRGASIPPPRSSSPRKTGINGSPRRSNGIDVLALAKGLPVIDPEDRENTPVLTPTRPAQSNVRRFSPSPEKLPLREVTTNGPASSRLAKGKQRAVEPLPQNHVNHPKADIIDHEEDKQMMDRFKPPRVVAPQDEDYNDFAPQGDDDEVSMNADLAFAPQVGLTPEDSDEQMHESIEIDEKEDFPPKSKAPNNRGARKRKSDSLEEDENLSSHEQSPPHQGAKKAKTATNKQPKAKNSRMVDYGFPLDPALAPGVQDEPRGRPAAKGKAQNPLLSTQQEAELGQIIERVKARPGQQKSLYILRRETPADDSAVHTRSGRVSVRPLAYWRNERCVYGGSPSGASLPEGARFPLNSIKEIIRTEEVDSRRSRSPSKGKRKGKKGNKGKGKGRAGGVENDADSDSDSASNSDVDGAWIDPEAEEWEANSGIYRGDVSIWDHDQQAPLDALEEVELAYAPASIQTKEVKSMHPDQRTFKFAKLLSISFFGSGIVELEPGDFKRPKNSRKMHMSFFVAKGRVTVEVGPLGGEMCRFSVGKGGFWQVPRGNQYSIENETNKPAKIFFSQACEPAPMMLQE